MKPPQRLPHPPQHVCHLCQAIQSLKQAPCAWFQKFSYVVGFIQSLHEHVVLFISLSVVTILILDINDMTITGDDPADIQLVKAFTLAAV